MESGFVGTLILALTALKAKYVEEFLRIYISSIGGLTAYVTTLGSLTQKYLARFTFTMFLFSCTSSSLLLTRPMLEDF